MTIAWIVTKGQPHLMQAFRAVHWEVKPFSPAEFRQAKTAHFWDVELIVFELSKGSQLDLCREICSKRIVPTLVLAPNLAYAQAGLEVGADDFVVLPADPIEALLRARKLVRAANFVRVGDLEIDLADWKVDSSGCRVHLSTIEFRLLACLAKRVGQTVSYAEIMEEVWGWETDYAALTQVKNGINRVRQKIEPDLRNPQYIITVPSEGYRLRNQRQWKENLRGAGTSNLIFYNEQNIGLG